MIKHDEMVQALVKPGADIVAQMTSEKAHLLHMALGVAGEAGELADQLKRHTIYNKPIDRDNVIEELGDLEFFVEGIRAELGISREEVLEANIRKLSARYHQGRFSDAQAQARADKA
jgi:NTP pyrophosphatase (non-canonical NTP hydrolase)